MGSDGLSTLAAWYFPNESNHIEESTCVLCMGKLKSHGTIIKRRAKNEMDTEDAKGVPKASGVNMEELGEPSGQEAGVSDDPLPEELEVEELEEIDDDTKDDAKVGDDGDVEMEESKEEIRGDAEAKIRMADGTFITASNLFIPKWIEDWKLGTKGDLIIDPLIGHWVLQLLLTTSSAW